MKCELHRESAPVVVRLVFKLYDWGFPQLPSSPGNSRPFVSSKPESRAYKNGVSYRITGTL